MDSETLLHFLASGSIFFIESFYHIKNVLQLRFAVRTHELEGVNYFNIFY